MNEEVQRSGDDRRSCQRMPTDCPAHSGQEEKIIALQGSISNRLTFNTWLLGILIALVITIFGYLNVANDEQNKVILIVKERQDHVMEWIKSADQRLTSYEKGQAELKGYDEALKNPKGRNK